MAFPDSAISIFHTPDTISPHFELKVTSSFFDKVQLLRLPLRLSSEGTFARQNQKNCRFIWFCPYLFVPLPSEWVSSYARFYLQVEEGPALAEEALCSKLARRKREKFSMQG